ncbi:MAG: hypothetical protein IJK81_11410 [Selenomonadaceae bacterium]|nr:hypothetical protein [Selenomonadaceae bacterium]
MATREENLKKINENLEKLTDEQLDQVAGGDRNQTIKDGYFLHALFKGTANAPESPKTVPSKWWDVLKLFEKTDVDTAAVTKAWDVLGIKFTENWGDNDYVVKDSGQKLSQMQAWTYASKLMGRE